MKLKFLSIPLITLLVAGCSTSTTASEPKYDELEVIQYEKCMDEVISARKNSVGGGIPDAVKFADEVCQRFIWKK